MGAILMMSGAYCLATESHVRGDVIYRLFKPRTQAWVDLTLYFIFFFPGVLALVFYGYDYAAFSWKLKESSWSSPAQIQIYMVKALIPTSGVILNSFKVSAKCLDQLYVFKLGIGRQEWLLQKKLRKF